MIRVNALVDSGAYFLAINERVLEQLGLSVIRKSTDALANGSIVDLKIVGPVEEIFENSCYC